VESASPSRRELIKANWLTANQLTLLLTESRAVNLLITVDVEAHRVIEEISGRHSDSLGDILASLRRFRCKATFFVDLCEVPTWGEKFMREVCDRIRDAGQDIQLHAHPHHLSGDSNRWLLSEYTREEQAWILDNAIEEYRKFVGRQPLAFRAGGFGANRDTLELLAERGVAIDCSLMQGWRGCHLTAPIAGVPFVLHGMREIPLTPTTLLGLPGRPLRTAAIDFNWMPLFVIKRILRRLRNEGASVATILMHSSSLCMRLGSKRFPYRRSRLKKLEKMLSFLQDEHFAVACVADCEQLGLWERVYPRPIVYVEANLAIQYLSLLFQSFVGASFKRRFAYFIGANAVALIVLAATIIYMMRRF
jgi:peptidoglycan/xylan/chitin deacetylase (PgdA/CDA1 family)